MTKGGEAVKQEIELPLARLVGVIENEGEHAACSLVFVLETDAGRTVNLTYGAVLEALRFAQDQGAVPPLLREMSRIDS